MSKFGRIFAVVYKRCHAYSVADTHTVDGNALWAITCMIQLTLLDPETGPQAPPTLLLFLFVLLLVLRLFHFTTDRRQTSRTH